MDQKFIKEIRNFIANYTENQEKREASEEDADGTYILDCAA